MGLNHAVINRNEVSLLEKKLAEPNHTDVMRERWQRNLTELRTDPEKYWSGFEIYPPFLPEEQERANEILFMKEYYRANPTQETEQLQLF